MAEYSAVARQTILPGESAIFTFVVEPCREGFVRFRNDTGNFLLSGWTPQRRNRCCCCGNQNGPSYFVDFGANIAISEGGTVEPISVAITIDGATDQASVMTVTPAAVEEFFNVSRATSIPVWVGCCQTVRITNIGTQSIDMENANIVINRTDLRR